MDPKAYLQHNRLHEEFCKKFYGELAADSGWSEGRLRMVMDIGCGPGNASTRWIDHYFPDIQKLIGVDIDPGMISLARERNTKKKIEFHVADIMKKESLKAWEGSADRIISCFVFHRLSDQKEAFRNVFDLLAPSGRASLIFTLKGPLYFAIIDLLKNPKWKSILEASNFVRNESLSKSYGSEFYKQMLEDIGFNVPFCETFALNLSYESDNECKNFLLSLHSIGEVSDQLKEDYKDDLFQQFVKHSPRDGEGRATNRMTALHVELVKPGQEKRR